MQLDTIELDGVTYSFSALTLEQEDEFENWVRESLRADARSECTGLPTDLASSIMVNMIARTNGSACSFTGPVGLEKLSANDGLMKVLEMASRLNHPNPVVPKDIWRKMLRERRDKVQAVVLNVVPFSAEHRQMILARLEKKAGGQTAGRS